LNNKRLTAFAFLYFAALAKSTAEVVEKEWLLHSIVQDRLMPFDGFRIYAPMGK
jgi:hypothetical protein